ncbi:MAG: membrane protein insertase YidC [Thermoanaerobaculia bacterium]
MEKRLFVAVLLSIAFLFGWAYVAPKLFPQLRRQPKPVAAESAKPVAPAPTTSANAETPATAKTTAAPAPPSSVASPAQPATAADRARDNVIETAAFLARFSNKGAQLVSFQLKEHKNPDGSSVDLIRPRGRERDDFAFAIRGADAAWTQQVNNALYVARETTTRSKRTLEYHYSDGRGTSVVKTFVFSDDYPFRFQIDVQGQSAPFRIELGPAIKEHASDQKDSQFLTTGNAVIQQGDSVDVIRREKADAFLPVDGDIALIGLEDNFFLAALRPDRHSGGIVRTAQFPGTAKDAKPRKEVYVGLNSAGGQVSGTAFFVPKQADLLERFGLDKTLSFGFFGFIARFLLEGLLWIYGYTKNYGWAIVVLTVIIKILLYPLQHKSIVSMKKMQKLQPKMNAIKEKYKKAKTDPEQRQKMNADMMKLYQQEKINPMSGCLPILLQLPILWAFYSMLSSAIELRGADFMMWITDLSAKDPYYITPILMTVTMFIQQKMTPTTADPVQKKIFMAMPFVFGFIFKDLPSGLVLYWLVQNVLTIIQQGIMNRYWKDHPEELAK